MTARDPGDQKLSAGDRRRRQILDAARACISEDGTDETTIRKVAERAGVSHPSVVYHFKSRKGLIDAALVEMSEALMHSLYSGRVKRPPPGPKALAELVTRFLDRNREGTGFVVKMIDAGLRDPELRSVHHEFIQYGCDIIEASILAGIATGAYRKDVDPQKAARMIHSLLVWWASELGSEATTEDQALSVVMVALDLMKYPAVDPAEVTDPVSQYVQKSATPV
jgi:AcrR family transcriptional regulator